MLRLAVASLVLIAALFLFVFPTSAVLHQRGQLNDAEQRLSVLKQQNAKARVGVQAGAERRRDRALARDRFNMVRPGEQAWAVVPGAATTTTTTTPPAPTPQATVPEAR